MSRKSKYYLKPQSGIQRYNESPMNYVSQTLTDNAAGSRSTATSTTEAQEPTVESYPGVPYHLQRLFYHLENVIVHRSNQMATKIDRVYNRTQVQLKALEFRFTERLSALGEQKQGCCSSTCDCRSSCRRSDPNDSAVRCARPVTALPLYGHDTLPTTVRKTVRQPSSSYNGV